MHTKINVCDVITNNVAFFGYLFGEQKCKDLLMFIYFFCTYIYTQLTELKRTLNFNLRPTWEGLFKPLPFSYDIF